MGKKKVESNYGQERKGLDGQWGLLLLLCLCQRHKDFLGSVVSPGELDTDTLHLTSRVVRRPPQRAEWLIHALFSHGIQNEQKTRAC